MSTNIKDQVAGFNKFSVQTAKAQLPEGSPIDHEGPGQPQRMAKTTQTVRHHGRSGDLVVRKE
jgi:hypothetical protein